MPRSPHTGSFDELVAEASDASVEGWDFSWLDGRATEQRPTWGYQKLIRARLGHALAALDVETGGGEVLAGAAPFPPAMAATESWLPNVTKAARLLHPLGVVVVATGDEQPLPFADTAFDLVVSRHPVTVAWDEIARVLCQGGTYLSQQVGPRSVVELTEHFLGPQPDGPSPRDPDTARQRAVEVGLDVVDLRMTTLRMEFFDVGAVVYFLRKVIWIVPGFSVESYVDRLCEVNEHILAAGSFVAHSTRFLIEAKKVA